MRTSLDARPRTAGGAAVPSPLSRPDDLAPRTAIAPIALASAVLDDLGGSGSDLGLVLAAGTVPLVLLLLVGGVRADRLPRQRVMLGADLVEFSAQAVPRSTALVPQTVSPEASSSPRSARAGRSPSTR